MDDVSFMLLVLKFRPLSLEVSKTHSQLEVEIGQAGGKDSLEKPFRLVAIFSPCDFLPLGDSISTL